MTEPLRVVHYLNQFFGGVGGEERAGVGPSVRPGPIGPGVRLHQLVHPHASVVASAICGDTYFGDHPEQATAERLELIRAERPDLVVLGPAFNAGRYGLACAGLGAAIARELGIPAVSGMHEENPGLELARERVLVIPTDTNAR